MSKMGRPLTEINWDDFNKLCALHCTLVEIAEWFDCSEDTIERAVKREFDCTFAELYKKKSSKGKSSLRRKQYEVAMSGNVSMLIWLGKNILDQSDKQEVKAETHATNVDMKADEYERKLIELHENRKKREQST